MARTDNGVVQRELAELAELRVRYAELEKQLNHTNAEIEKTISAYERGEDLARRINALQRLRSFKSKWTVELVLDKIRDWVELYGEPPTAMAWNPAQARARDREDVIVDFVAGDWPHASTVQKLCGGWNKAIKAAGFEPLTAEDGASRRMKETNAKHGDLWPEWTGWVWIHVYRERAGMTQAQVAAAADLSQAWVQQVETGEQTNPRLRALLAFAAAVDVRPAVLLEDIPDEAEDR